MTSMRTKCEFAAVVPISALAMSNRSVSVDRLNPKLC